MIIVILGAVLAIVLTAFPNALDENGPWRVFAFTYASLSPLGAIAAILVLRGLRFGTSRHCPNCEYEHESQDGVSSVKTSNCPECGRLWSRGLVTGRRRKSWGSIGIMVACGLVGIGFGLQLGMAYTSRMSGLAPTWLLLRQIRLESRSQVPASQSVWAEVLARKLEPAQEQEVAELAIGLLRNRGKHSPSSEWLRTLHLKNRMSSELEARYLEARLECRMKVVEVDGLNRLWIDVTDHDASGIGSLAVVLDRCWIEPSGIQLAQQDIWFRMDWDDGSVQQVRVINTEEGGTYPSFAVTIPYDFVGDVKARLWVFWSPMSTCLSPISPRKLAADPSLDLRLSLVRTVELSVPFSNPPRTGR